MQLGSNALGRANDEDAEKGLVYLDVFKHSRLDALKPREVDEEEMKPKNGVWGWESVDLDTDLEITCMGRRGMLIMTRS